MKNFKAKSLKVVLCGFACACAMALTACIGGGTSEPTRYYMIDVEKAEPLSNAASAKTVQVRKFTMDPAYQKTNIVYRESAYTFMFYDLDLWASRPDQMLTKTATKYVEQSKLFASKAANASKPDYEILGNVDAIEEVDEGSNRNVHLDITLTFKKTEGEGVLFEHEYDEQVAMEGAEPQYVAMGISKLYGKFMEDFLKNVQQNMGE